MGVLQAGLRGRLRAQVRSDAIAAAAGAGDLVGVNKDSYLILDKWVTKVGEG